MQIVPEGPFRADFSCRKSSGAHVYRKRSRALTDDVLITLGSLDSASSLGEPADVRAVLLFEPIAKPMSAASTAE